jgi:3'(2'), 5'-bisphosphate nucleotidase
MSLVHRVVAVAREAGEAILEVYAREDFGTTFKDDRSPLTLADRAAHHRIVERLAAIDGGIPILSEESESIPYATRAAYERFWLVDPLDGTKEFIKRNGEFTVNIALIEQGVPVLGVVHAPVLDRTYWAARGEGAFVANGSEAAATAIAVSDYRTAGLRVVASRSHAGELMPKFLDAMGSPECVSIGSSLKLCLVADGSANLYPRFGPTMEWDIAAAYAVVVEAGGTITADTGEPLAFNKPDMHNPYFVVCGNPPYPWRDVYLALTGEAAVR